MSCQRVSPKPPGRNGSKGAVGRLHSDISSISPSRTPDFTGRPALPAEPIIWTAPNENTLHAYTGRHRGSWLGLGDFVDQRARTAKVATCRLVARDECSAFNV